ncbi:MAG: SemiSWEET transporter [Deltaproteobacteria bacterium]|nr:SemiSWEET transporter [Deltaproteobacteria bacterium]
MIDSITLLGLVGGTLTTVSFVPQVVKTWRSRSAKDVSLWMFLILSLGIVIWIIYGFLIDSFPVIAANIVSFILVFAILMLKIVFR